MAVQPTESGGAGGAGAGAAVLIEQREQRAHFDGQRRGDRPGHVVQQDVEHHGNPVGSRLVGVVGVRFRVHGRQ
ncbi:hypothetical protein [Actinomadura sediminis]|uniref:Uncharacterized protein n=1 Tax=Actinomadura sediminis TaxID=1038904 RepID=A0ABW3EKU0_9ACTN